MDPCKDLKLIITCPHSKEDIAGIEVLDLLVPYDMESRAAKTAFRGVLLIYSPNLSSWDAWRIVMGGPTAYVFRVVPVETCVKSSLDEIVSSSVRLSERILGNCNTFMVKCVRRGRKIKSSLELCKIVGARVAEKTGAKVSLANPDYIIFIEIVGDITGMCIVDSSISLNKVSSRVKE